MELKKHFPYVLFIFFALGVIGYLGISAERKKSLFESAQPENNPAAVAWSAPLPPAWLEVAIPDAGKKKDDCSAARSYEFLCEVGHEERMQLMENLKKGISPQGQYFARVIDDSILQINSIKNGQELDRRPLVTQESPDSNEKMKIELSNMQWSPNGNFLWVEYREVTPGCQKISLECLNTKNAIWSVDKEGKFIGSASIRDSVGLSQQVAWSPDESTIAITPTQYNSITFLDTQAKVKGIAYIQQQKGSVEKLLWKGTQLYFTTRKVNMSHSITSSLGKVYVDFSLLPSAGKKITAWPKDVPKPYVYPVHGESKLALPVSYLENFPVFAELVAIEATETTTVLNPKLLLSLENRALSIFGEKEFVFFDEQNKKNTRAIDVKSIGNFNITGGGFCDVQQAPNSTKNILSISTGGSCQSEMELVEFDWRTQNFTPLNKRVEKLLPWSDQNQGFIILQQASESGAIRLYSDVVKVSL